MTRSTTELSGTQQEECVQKRFILVLVDKARISSNGIEIYDYSSYLLDLLERQMIVHTDTGNKERSEVDRTAGSNRRSHMERKASSKGNK